MNIETVEDAYAEAMASVEKLRQSGIALTLVVPKSASNPETISKFADRLPLDKWRHVTFFPSTQIDSDEIQSEHRRLIDLGIGFDSGGGSGERDWELDWSLRLIPPSDPDQVDRVARVDDLLKQMDGTLQSEGVF